MEALINFYGTYGLALTLSAIAGVVLLGAMKYTKMFMKFEERTRHLIYVIISVMFSTAFALIYMIMAENVDVDTLWLFAMNTFALNQTFYNIFKVTTLKDLANSLLDKITNFFEK